MWVCVPENVPVPCVRLAVKSNVNITLKGTSLVPGSGINLTVS